MVHEALAIKGKEEITTETQNNTPNIKVFVPPSFEGVMSAAILEEVINKDITLDIQYTGNLDFREYSQFGDAYITIALGLPYRGYALPEDFYMYTDVPFSDFIHISTYGEKIEGNHINSVVEPDQDPIKVLMDTIQNQPETYLLSKHVNITDKARYLVEAVNSYRTWTWENNDTTRVMLALYHASYKRLPNLVRGLQLQDVVKSYAPLIKGQMEKMEDYIVRKIETAKEYNINIDGENGLLKIVYADQYINELANRMLSQPTPLPVVVCVGRSTKGNDIFSIRTDKVDAGRVAYLINEGSGKDSVATVFSGVGYAELMGNAIVTKLNEGSN